MSSYATVAQLREYLTQVQAGAANDALLQTVLDRANGTVNGRLGFEFAAWGVAGTARDVQCGSNCGLLFLPPYKAGSVTVVAALSGRGTTAEATEAITDFVAEEYERPFGLWRGVGWSRGGWYRVTAIWGFGPAPAEVVEVELELAVNLWGSRDARQITDVVGVEGGGAVGYMRALTNRQRMILDDVRAKYGQWGFA